MEGATSICGIKHYEEKGFGSYDAPHIPNKEKLPLHTLVKRGDIGRSP